VMHTAACFCMLWIVCVLHNVAVATRVCCVLLACCTHSKPAAATTCLSMGMLYGHCCWGAHGLTVTGSDRK
jgi:hypothetical protein